MGKNIKYFLKSLTFKLVLTIQIFRFRWTSYVMTSLSLITSRARERALNTLRAQIIPNGFKIILNRSKRLRNSSTCRIRSRVRTSFITFPSLNLFIRFYSHPFIPAYLKCIVKCIQNFWRFCIVKKIWLSVIIYLDIRGNEK